MTQPPSEAELRGFLTSLSNWGRWGDGVDGLLGTLNLLSQEATAAAASRVRRGEVVSCGLPIVFSNHPAEPDAEVRFSPGEATESPMHYMLRHAELIDALGKEQTRAAPHDGFVLEPHGRIMTHLDSPAHTILDGVMFNGVPATDSIGLDGAGIGAIDMASDGIAGRGVLLDVAAAKGVDWLDDDYAIFPEDLELCEKLQGIEVGTGDCLLVRTGYRGRSLTGPPKGPGYSRPGIQAACLPWLKERDIAVLGSDVPNDCFPFGYELGLPIHTVGMWAIGLWLVDNCYLETLSTRCAELGQHSFLFTIAPLILARATASPVNPLALF